MSLAAGVGEAYAPTQKLQCWIRPPWRAAAIVAPPKQGPPLPPYFLSLANAAAMAARVGRHNQRALRRMIADLRRNALRLLRPPCELPSAS